MLHQREKFEAIRHAFPHIPEREVPKVAQRIRVDGDLYRIISIVTSYIRHQYTKYDAIQKSAVRVNGCHVEARGAIRDDLFTVLKSWS